MVRGICWVFFFIHQLGDSGAYYTTAKNGVAALKGKTTADKTTTDLTLESNFDVNGVDSVAIKGGLYELVGVEYEKMGLRGQLAIDFAFGLGVASEGWCCRLLKIFQTHIM